MMKRIPGTSRVVFVANHAGDVVWDMSNFPEVDNSIKQESIPMTGTWEDYTGSGTKPAQMVMMQGIANELEGDLVPRAEDDAYFSELDERGKRVATHRSRNKLITLE